MFKKIYLLQFLRNGACDLNKGLYARARVLWLWWAVLPIHTDDLHVHVCTVLMAE